MSLFVPFYNASMWTKALRESIKCCQKKTHHHNVTHLPVREEPVTYKSGATAQSSPKTHFDRARGCVPYSPDTGRQQLDVVINYVYIHYINL